MRSHLVNQLIRRAEKLGKVPLPAPAFALHLGGRRCIARHHRRDLHVVVVKRTIVNVDGQRSRSGRAGLVEHVPGLRGLVERCRSSGGAAKPGSAHREGGEAEEWAVDEHFGALWNGCSNLGFVGAEEM